MWPAPFYHSWISGHITYYQFNTKIRSLYIRHIGWPSLHSTSFFLLTTSKKCKIAARYSCPFHAFHIEKRKQFKQSPFSLNPGRIPLWQNPSQRALIPFKYFSREFKKFFGRTQICRDIADGLSQHGGDSLHWWNNTNEYLSFGRGWKLPWICIAGPRQG